MKLLPVDWVIALYNVVMIGVWTPLAPSVGTARWMIAVHLAGLGLVWLLARLPERTAPGVGVVRDLYPIAWLIVFWRELGIHCELVGSAANDAFIAWVDRTLFTTNLSSVWAPTMSMGWFSELWQGIYFSYYILFVALGLYLILGRGREVARDTVFRLSITYVACFIPYAIAPTVGPMFMYPRFAGAGLHGLFRFLNDSLQAAGDAAGTAFPSTHVAGGVTLAWLAWRYCPGWFAWIVTLIAIGIAPATVYTQNHFLLDAVGGGLLGLTLQLVTAPRPVRAPRAAARGGRRLPVATEAEPA